AEEGGKSDPSMRTVVKLDPGSEGHANMRLYRHGVLNVGPVPQSAASGFAPMLNVPSDPTWTARKSVCGSATLGESRTPFAVPARLSSGAATYTVASRMTTRVCHPTWLFFIRSPP